MPAIKSVVPKLGWKFNGNDLSLDNSSLPSLRGSLIAAVMPIFEDAW